MIKNSKFYAPPPDNGKDIKQLFAYAIERGLGQPVDAGGVPVDHWTPETLAEAISVIDRDRSSVDIRTVQYWFQLNNRRNISVENCRWLAIIFGCGDSDAISEWQAALLAARRLFQRDRRRDDDPKFPTSTQSRAPLSFPSKDQDQQNSGEERLNSQGVYEEPIITGRNFALRCERMFSGPNYLNMPILIWSGLAVLWFLSFSLGVHSVTYTLSGNIEKQVGFIWSPAWNVGEPIFMPIFLITCSSLINVWKRKDRKALQGLSGPDPSHGWYKKVRSFSSSFWVILAICGGLIFCIQWTGVYLLPLLSNGQNVVMIDWMLVALVRPDVLSNEAAIFVSFLGFLYSGMIYWFLFTGLLFLFSISSDYAEICAARSVRADEQRNGHALEAAQKIMHAVFRCTIFGIIVALCIKVNAAYLISDASSIASWLWQDALTLLGHSESRWDWINGSPSPFYTSFILLFVLCFVFGACNLQVKTGIEEAKLFAWEHREARRSWLRMWLVLVLLSLGYLSVGQFYGFSLVLGGSVIVALASLLWKAEPNDHQHNLKEA